MRAVIQRVTQARVDVAGECVGRIDEPGILALIGVAQGDSTSESGALAAKIAHLRILEGEKSALDRCAPVLVVSQFTLYGDTRHGRRPSWSEAASSEQAQPLVERVVLGLRDLGLTVATGRFGAYMQIRMTADGPFTVSVEV